MTQQPRLGDKSGFMPLPVYPFNQKRYPYNGEQLWERVAGKFSIRMRRRIYKGNPELYVTIRVADNRIPSTAVSKISIYFEHNPENKVRFTNKGEAKLPYREGETGVVLLESDE